MADRKESCSGRTMGRGKHNKRCEDLDHCKWITGVGCQDRGSESSVSSESDSLSTGSAESIRSTESTGSAESSATCKGRTLSLGKHNKRCEDLDHCKWVPGTGCVDIRDISEVMPGIHKSQKSSAKTTPAKQAETPAAKKADKDCINMVEWDGATPSQRKKYRNRVSPPYPGTGCCGKAKMGQDTEKGDRYSDKAFYALPRKSKSGKTSCVWRPCRFGEEGEFAKDISSPKARRACEEAEMLYEQQQR